MATANPDDINPFRAPVASINAPTLAGLSNDAEMTRRTYLSHEASIKSLGSLNYLAAFFCLLAVVGFGLAALGLIDIQSDGFNGVSPRAQSAIFAGIAALGLLLYGGIGYGLQHLQVWARWVTIVLMGLSLALFAFQVVVSAVVNPVFLVGVIVSLIIPTLINGYIFYLVASAKGSMVFSHEYREVVRQTPHIKYRTSLLIKLFLGSFLVLIVLGILAVLFGGSR